MYVLYIDYLYSPTNRHWFVSPRNNCIQYCIGPKAGQPLPPALTHCDRSSPGRFSFPAFFQLFCISSSFFTNFTPDSGTFSCVNKHIYLETTSVYCSLLSVIWGLDEKMNSVRSVPVI
jgi:hypothetical protein